MGKALTRLTIDKGMSSEFKLLEQNKLVMRKVYNEIPALVEYTLRVYWGKITER